MDTKTKKQQNNPNMPSTLQPYRPSEEVKAANDKISLNKSKKFAAQAMDMFKLG